MYEEPHVYPDIIIEKAINMPDDFSKIFLFREMIANSQLTVSIMLYHS